MVAEKLKAESQAIAAEGWKWIEVAPDFAYGHAFGLRQLRGQEASLTADEEATRSALQAEYDRLSEEYADADELSDGVDQRFGELETAIEAFETRPVVFDPADVVRAGAFVSIAHDGALRVERGYVRPEDELPTEPETGPAGDDQPDQAAAASHGGHSVTADEPHATTRGRGGSLSDLGSAADGTHRPQDARPAPGARRTTRRRLPRRPARPLAQGVLSLWLG